MFSGRSRSGSAWWEVVETGKEVRLFTMVVSEQKMEEGAFRE